MAGSNVFIYTTLINSKRQLPPTRRASAQPAHLRRPCPERRARDLRRCHHGNAGHRLLLGLGGQSSGEGGKSFRLRCRTLSVSRYSICPLIERKSSSAHLASSSQREGERRRRICFRSFFTSAMESVEGATVDDRLYEIGRAHV